MVMDYDRGTVEIKWDTGHMMLILDNSFPSSDRWIKKLWKTVAMDWEHKKEISEGIVEWLKKKEAYCSDKDIMQKLANAAVSAQTSANEMQPEIDSLKTDIEKYKRLIDGLKRTLERERRKDERKKLTSLKKKEQENLKVMRKQLKALQERQQTFINIYRTKTCCFNDMERDSERYKRNIELIEQLSEGWN